MDLNHSQFVTQTLDPYPSISIFSLLLSNSTATVPLSARALLDICRTVARDLKYVARLREEAQHTLDMCPAHHAEWIDEARRSASQALYLVNQHIESKIPQKEGMALLRGNMSDLQAKVISVVTPNKKDTECVSSLRTNLTAAHTSLMTAAGLMQELAIRSGDLLPDTTQLRRFRTLSSGSEGQGTNRGAVSMLGSETSTLG